MAISGVQGPLVVYGSAQPQTTAPDYNPEQGPSLIWGGSGILDPRSAQTYDPGQNFGSLVCGWAGASRIQTLNCIPMTKSTTLIAAAANTVAATPMTLVSSNASGIAVKVNGSLFNSTSGASLVNALCIDPLVSSITANLVIASNVMTVTAVAAGGGACYNRLSIGMVLTDATTAGNLPTGVFIIGYGTGNGGVGTYYLSANAVATATGDTVTGLFTGLTTGFVNPLLSSGSSNTLPFGSACTVQLYNPMAMCSRAISITSNTSQVVQNFVVNGADVYGNAMTETITTSGTSATTTNGKKAWKYIQSVTPSVTDGTGTYSVGTQDIVGLPLRSDNFTALVGTEWDLSLYFNSAGIAGTTGYVAAVTTNPATAITGDVRGSYALQTAASGTLRLIASQSPDPAAFGVSSNPIGVGLFGVPQYTAW